MIDIRIGDKFTEESEHNSKDFIVTKIEKGRIFAKEVINENIQKYGEERSFSEEELLHGKTFCSYWFYQRKDTSNNSLT